MEELEERLGDQMDTVLAVIRDSIPHNGAPAESTIRTTPPPQVTRGEGLFLEDDDPNWDYHEEQVFDDGGEGTGIEGDLEADDD